MTVGRLAKDRGATAAEYALMLALIFVVLIGAAIAYANAVGGLFDGFELP